MMEAIYAPESVLQVVLVSGLLGGGAAWLAGRALARTWRPFWHVIVYTALIACSVRFVHFALFEGDLLSLPAYLADTSYLLLVGMLGWRATRAWQMATQYPWLYERTSWLTWRPKSDIDRQPEKG
jgi:hypothetical protein